jgi:lipoprotein NlpI
MENLSIFFQLYYRPGFAMSEIMDRGSWVFAAASVLLVAFLTHYSLNSRLDAVYTPAARDLSHVDFDDPNDQRLQRAVVAADNAYDAANAARPRIPIVGDRFFSFFTFDTRTVYKPLLSISLFYVPISILLMSFIGKVGNFGVVLRRDYAALATCTLMSWSAAHLPFALAALVVAEAAAPPPHIFLALWAGGGTLFGVFMVFAHRTVFGSEYSVALVVVGVAWLAFSFGTTVLGYISPWLFSPFLLFFALLYFGGYLGGEIRGLGNAFRRRQDFKRFLQNATINPKDADAHVQLGLIYLQRRQTAKAAEHFRRAYEIDPDEIDANYELGKLARQDGRLQDALDHFAVVLEQNDKHSLSEIWREVGATYAEAGMLEEALNSLEKFVERRAFDIEGLYRLGATLKRLGEQDRATELFVQAVDAGQTSPSHRRRETAYWARLARKEL